MDTDSMLANRYEPVKSFYLKHMESNVKEGNINASGSITCTPDSSKDNDVENLTAALEGIDLDVKSDEGFPGRVWPQEERICELEKSIFSTLSPRAQSRWQVLLDEEDELFRAQFAENEYAQDDLRRYFESIVLVERMTEHLRECCFELLEIADGGLRPRLWREFSSKRQRQWLHIRDTEYQTLSSEVALGTAWHEQLMKHSKYRDFEYEGDYEGEMCFRVKLLQELLTFACHRGAQQSSEIEYSQEAS